MGKLFFEEGISHFCTSAIYREIYPQNKKIWEKYKYSKIRNVKLNVEKKEKKTRRQKREQSHRKTYLLFHCYLLRVSFAAFSLTFRRYCSFFLLYFAAVVIISLDFSCFSCFFSSSVYTYVCLPVVLLLFSFRGILIRRNELSLERRKNFFAYARTTLPSFSGSPVFSRDNGETTSFQRSQLRI